MTALPASPPSHTNQSLTCIARFPNLRALAWNGDQLYAARGYQLLCAQIKNPAEINWQPVGAFHPPFRRKLSVATNLTARLFRDGFHALATLTDGSLVAAVPGAIITLRPGEKDFCITHAITRGTRPLHITAVPGGAVYWGEYFDNPHRDEVHIYASTDSGQSWNVAYTFPKVAIRHVHNTVHDPWANCLWILTGDYGDECRILRASLNLREVEPLLQGNQQTRAVALVPAEDALYFSTDTPLESNFIYRLERTGNLTRLAPISSSSIYGCRAGNEIFFSTMVEPSKANPDQNVRIYGGRSNEEWFPLLAWEKDRWPQRYFQYGNAFLPDGNNNTEFLALSTIAVTNDDMATSLYQWKSGASAPR
ncbi:MAG TPA: hypothetical protein VMH04_00610 [Candidatus Solibacter sp.]|nr:hypothetical protein [Candidatus Solibacter sp.]